MDVPLWWMWVGNCLTGVVLYVHKGKGNRNKTEKETGDLLREILGPWIPPGGKKNKKKVPPRSVAVKEILGSWIPPEGKKKKGSTQICSYEGEGKKWKIYIYFLKKESKDKNKHEAIGWERALRSHEENAINVEMVKMVRRVFK